MATEPEGKIIMTNTTFAAASTTNTAIDTSFTAYFTFDHVGERILGCLHGKGSVPHIPH